MGTDPTTQAQPVTVLPYCTPSADPWRSLIRLICWAAIVYGAIDATAILMSPYWVQEHLSHVFLRIIAGLRIGSSIGLLVGGAGALWFRSQARQLLIFSALAAVVHPALDTAFAYTVGKQKFGFDNTPEICQTLLQIIFPVLVILIMDKRVVREIFKARSLAWMELAVIVLLIGSAAPYLTAQYRANQKQIAISQLQSQLQTLRSQLELFALQHGDQYPRLITNGWSELTGKTIRNGQTFGPYMMVTPVNPLAGSSTVAKQPSPGIGWIYNETTGALNACDEKGQSLNY